MVAMGLEVCRCAALVLKDEVGSQVARPSVVEELVELLVKAELLKGISRALEVSKQSIHTVCGSIEEGHLALQRFEVRK